MMPLDCTKLDAAEKIAGRMSSRMDAGKVAYRGYLIIETFGGEFLVEKDGYRIVSAPSMSAAKKEIDGLVA